MSRTSILAKLLAEENIHVVHKNVKTASFDVKSRELVLPIWENMSIVLEEMLTLHEVGHALFTPLDMLEKSFDLGLNKSIVNILEDAREEKLVKRKYLGSVSTFTRGYRELLEKDFFGLSGKDVSEFSLPDKINIFFKTGVDIGFTESEKEWIPKVESLETPDDVLTLAAELEKVAKENANDSEYPEYDFDENSDETIEVMDNNESNEDAEESESEVQIETPETDGDGEETEQESGEDGQTSDESSDAEESDSEESSKTGEFEPDSTDGTTGEGYDEEDIGFTDDALSDSLQQLNADDDATHLYGKLPKSIDLSKIIVDYKTVIQETNESFEGMLDNKYWITRKDYVTIMDFYDRKIVELQKKSNPVVNAMVKEFEMKKSADLYKRASVSKTGSLDMNRIHTYKYNDDLFLKMTTVPEGTNHGMVLYLDWSGSMDINMWDTIRQLLQLVWFCQKVKIPFEVYAFTNQYKNGVQTEAKRGEVRFSDLNLLNLFSSRMKKSEFSYVARFLASQFMWVNYRDLGSAAPNARNSLIEIRHCNVNYRLGATPLNAAIVASIYVTDQFIKQTGVQKVNSIFLTDGDSHVCERIQGDGDYFSDYEINGSYKTKYHIEGRSNQKNILDVGNSRRRWENITSYWLKVLKSEHPSMNIVGFFIAGNGKNGTVPSSVIERKMNISKFINEQEFKNARKALRDDKILVTTSQGYDEFYILPAVRENAEEVLDVEQGASVAKLKKAFMKSNSSKVTNRQLVNRFIKMVA